MLIDTHCHLDFPDFDADRSLVMERAAQAGVGVIINVASSLRASREAVRLAGEHASVYASVGIHPHDAKEFSAQALAELERLSCSPKVVAVGEVGLDFYRTLSPQDEQIEAFRRFIALALEKNLPLIVHSRLAQDQTLLVLEESGAVRLKGVVIHCFSGDVAYLEKCLGLGFFVSFTANITYKKAHAMREVVAHTPLERMFLETDAPFLSPEGKRGTRNEPAHTALVAQEVARVKGVTYESVCDRTTQNARNFFGLP
jgi:TatD DNase family protein